MSKILKLLFIILGLILVTSCSLTSKQVPPKEKELETLVAELESKHMFNGAILVAEKGEILIRKVVGLSDFEKKQPLKFNSTFDIASVSKTFTSLAINQLVEQGKMSLDDKITTYFPKLPYKNISIRQLLNHTSGLYDVSGDRELRKKFISFYNKEDVPYTNNDYLAFIEKYKPGTLSEPGEKFYYSNTAYVLLGMVIEKVSGQEYDKFIDENIFKPAGMENTYVFSKMEEGAVPGFVQGHYWNPKDGVVNVNNPDVKPKYYGLTFGDDDIASTLDDLFAYDQTLRYGKLVTKETLDQILAPPSLNNGQITEYGLGFSVVVKNNLRYVSHTGGSTGFTSLLKFSRPDNDNTVIILMNLKGNRKLFSVMRNSINNILLGKKYDLSEL